MAFQRVSMNPKTSSNSSPTVSDSPSSSQGAASQDGVAQALGGKRESFRMRTLSADSVQSAKKESTFNSQSEETKMKTGITRKTITIGVAVVLLLGVGTGLAGAYLTTRGSGVAVVSPENQKTAQEVENAVRVGAVFGVPDEKTFRDDTSGILIKGGLDGEGSHTLLRPGGESQNVYLTSSVVDLDQFEGHEIRIWGETFKGQKAGWLMDVGRVEIEALNADKPEWYTESM